MYRQIWVLQVVAVSFFFSVHKFAVNIPIARSSRMSGH
jgi:hypothetical protein